ncbi:MAG: hypothetical protein PVJ43_09430 [Gemmatimonadales bacterium]|jgi:hypothetical protein
MINKLFAALGQTIAREGAVPSAERFLRHIGRAGLTPVSVFDIGVAEDAVAVSGVPRGEVRPGRSDA